MRQFRSSIPWLKYLLFTLHNQGYPWLCKTRFRLMVSLYRVGVEPTGFQRMISVHRTSHILRLSLSQERPDPDFLQDFGNVSYNEFKKIQDFSAKGELSREQLKLLVDVIPNFIQLQQKFVRTESWGQVFHCANNFSYY